MSKKIPVLLNPNLDEVPFTPILSDWFGTRTPSLPRFRFFLTETTLNFDFKVSERGVYSQNHQCGDFVEGLWESDVCEFFVGGPSEEYMEFNVGPQGAWWGALFSGYRTRESTLESAITTVKANTTGDAWEVRFSVNLGDLKPWRNLTPEEYRLSVTSISHANEVQYYCFGHSQGGEPDFHLAENRLPLELG